MNVTIRDSDGNSGTDIDIPLSVIEAAQTIHNWAVSQGYVTYEIGNLCSRNHAERLRKLKELVDEPGSPVE